jgi:hypothetical protein
MRSWEDNIKTELKGVGCEDMDWIRLTQDMTQWWAHVNKVINLL